MTLAIQIALFCFMALLALSFRRKTNLPIILTTVAAGTVLTILQFCVVLEIWFRYNLFFSQISGRNAFVLATYLLPTVWVWIKGMKELKDFLKNRRKEGRRRLSRRELIERLEEQDERIAQLERRNSGRNRPWVITPKKGSRIGSFFQCFKVKSA